MLDRFGLRYYLFLSSFRWVKQEGELAKQEANQSAAPKLDLGFKEGQTIKISLGVREKKIMI